MVYHKCSVNLFSWLPWHFCSCSFQRQTEGHTPAGCWFSLISAPRLPIPGVNLLMFVPMMLLLVTAEAAVSKAVNILHSTAPTQLCFPKWEHVLSICKIRKQYSLLSICFYFFMNTMSMPLTFLLVDWLLEKLLAKSTCNSRGGDYLMVFMFAYYF